MNRILGIALALWLALSTSLHAQMTTLPEEGKLLGYASMDTSGRWLVFGPDGLKPIQPTVVDGGRAIFYQGVAGEYAIIFLPPDGADQPVVHTQILGGGTPPDPPPPPVPTTDISKKVVELYGKVPGETKTTEAAALATMYEQLAAEIKTASDPLSETKLVTPVAALEQMAADARAVLGGRRDAWNPWFSELAPFMTKQFEDGRLPRTVFGVGQAFAQIAAGLRSVR